MLRELDPSNKVQRWHRIRIDTKGGLRALEGLVVSSFAEEELRFGDERLGTARIRGEQGVNHLMRFWGTSGCVLNGRQPNGRRHHAVSFLRQGFQNLSALLDLASEQVEVRECQTGLDAGGDLRERLQRSFCFG